MARTKNKKKMLAEASTQKKRQDAKKTINRFEVHINKDKQKVLGKKSKADRGLPGVSRAKAIHKRKDTLFHEFSNRDKDNVFMDRRIGERNASMSAEEKAMARYAAEQVKAHKKKNIFSLNDEEVLTHRGQTLEEIERFEDPKSDDEYDEEDDRNGQLDKKFVGDAHFGGGVLSKSDGPLSRRDLIDQLIFESKKRKALQQKRREETIDLTAKLDSEWTDLLPLVGKSSRKMTEEVVVKTKADDYDIAVRQLKFESRGLATDRLKSEEEIMTEEKEKLEALEQDRLARMKGFIKDSQSKNTHKSADDLDDGFQVEDIEEEDGPIVYGEDGVLKKTKKKKSDDEESDQEQSGDVEVEQKDSESESEAEVNEEAGEEGEEGEEEEEEKEEEEEDDDDESEDDDEDENLSDLKASDSSSEDEEPEISNEELKPVEKENEDVPNIDRVKEIREDLQKRKEMMEKARQELPYTYAAPNSFEELHELLHHQKPDYQSIILERIIKCNHWSLGQDNREKLCNVFDYLLKYIIDYSKVTSEEDVVKCFGIFDRVCPHLYDLAQASPQFTWTSIQTVMKEKHEEFEKQQKKYPGLDTLILFKIVSLLFPTSDFRHPVVTPCIIFMSQILLRCRVKTKLDISKGLFVSTLMLEFTTMSQRFSPAVINFLRGVIYLATLKRPPMILKMFPPFKQLGELSNLLVLVNDEKKLEIEPLAPQMRAKDLIRGKIDDDFRVRAFLTAVNLVHEFKKQLIELDAVYAIFEPIINLLQLNSYDKYPKNVEKHVNGIAEDLATLKDKKLEYLVRGKKKPKALRLYEPRIEKIYDGKKHRPMSKEKAEREKLRHKLKKEMKGAIREVRKDTAFLAKVQIKEQIKSDAERKRRVKEIYGEGAAQQGELNAIKRKK